jgi:putative spermidine/putrescine transport system ATP-binding protein
MFDVKIKNLTKKFVDNTAVNNVNFEINSGEFFSILGPSGCGKTTTLRMIAGFVMPTDGEIFIGNTDITFQAPEKRNIGFVFQNYAIFPHMNVFDNISFGLKMRSIEQNLINEKVKKALDQVNLSGYENRFQRELSGGEQQRVALARVLVTEPQILLLDEPLSALDKKLREEMKIWIKELQKQLKITTVYVTHDQSEALTMSDRIAIMNNGDISQIGTPTEIYEKPLNSFVADFIGTSNFIKLNIISKNINSSKVSFAKKEFDIDYNVSDNFQTILRPEHIFINPKNINELITYEATLKIISYQGSLIKYIIEVESELLTAEIANHLNTEKLTEGDKITVGFNPKSLVII